MWNLLTQKAGITGFLFVIVTSHTLLRANVWKCNVGERYQKLTSCSRFRPLILIALLSQLPDFSYLPMMALLRQGTWKKLGVTVWSHVGASQGWLWGLLGKMFGGRQLSIELFGLSGANQENLASKTSLLERFGGSSCNLPSWSLRVAFFVRWCRFQLAIEVWIYFPFLEIWPGADIGTFHSLLAVPRYPQHMVSLHIAALKIWQFERLKIRLTEFAVLLPFHP